MSTAYDLNDAEILVQIAEEYITQHAEELAPFKRRRRVVKNVDFSQTTWGRMLDDPETRDIHTRAGKTFRRRFRVPYPLFEELLVPLTGNFSIRQLRMRMMKYWKQQRWITTTMMTKLKKTNL